MRSAIRLKQAVISKLISFLDYNRLSINNFNGTSREVTSVYEFRAQEPPSTDLMKLTSMIYAEYNHFCKIYKPPSLVGLSNSEIRDLVGWSKEPLMMQGNHYALLPLIINLLSAQKIVEIGTFRGASAKSILSNCNITSLTTFDIEPWNNFKPTFLSNDIFDSFPISQIICDLSNAESFSSYSNIFLDADLVFLDAAKNYFFEKSFLSLLFNLYHNNTSNSLALVINDVNLSTMTRIWRSIEYPKIKFDLIGHWSGTGFVLIGV